MSTLIAPLATMEEAWQERERLQALGNRFEAERDRLWAKESPTRKAAQAESIRLQAERDRLWAEARLVVVVTAQALYGQDAQINWTRRTAEPITKENA